MLGKKSREMYCCGKEPYYSQLSIFSVYNKKNQYSESFSDNKFLYYVIKHFLI